MSTPAPAPSSSPDMLTYEDAATLLGIGVGAIKRAVHIGKLHPVRLPGSNRKYLERAEVLAYPDRRNAPVSADAPTRHASASPAPSSLTASPALPDADTLRELASALSGPTIEALRDAQATSRAGIEGLVRIAFGLAIGATGGVPSPKA